MDVGFWGVDEYQKSDLMELKVRATVRQQARDVQHAETVEMYHARLNSPMKMTCAFIHEDRLFISGTSKNISFHKIK